MLCCAGPRVRIESCFPSRPRDVISNHFCFAGNRSVAWSALSPGSTRSAYSQQSCLGRSLRRVAWAFVGARVRSRLRRACRLPGGRMAQQLSSGSSDAKSRTQSLSRIFIAVKRGCQSSMLYLIMLVLYALTSHVF